jgi:formylglycine-generating enzyme required for sulfatase activity/ketosteroid isomerase-like protein
MQTQKHLKSHTVVRASISMLFATFASAQVGQAEAANSVHSPAAQHTNSIGIGIGISFVRIPAGSFMMGSGDDDRDAGAAEKPRHRVTITRPFYLARHEVTLTQWEAVMGNSPFNSRRSNPYYDLPGMAERLRKPSNPATVSWNDAQAFIQRLNEREGHRRYRLPTEAEWEYAARAGTTTTYSFGDDVQQLGRYAWYGEDFASGATHPVGQKLPNAWGLYDVHGNVWEWVQDRYSDAYYANSPASDPPGPASGTSRTVRGGSWHVTSGSWRSAFRKPYDPDYRGISIGFRLLLEEEAIPPRQSATRVDVPGQRPTLRSNASEPRVSAAIARNIDASRRSQNPMSQPPAEQQAIHALYSRMHRAMVASDTRTLASMLTDDFHLVHMTGYDQPRAEWLAHIESGQMRYHDSAEEEVVIKVDGSQATLRGRNRVNANIWGARGIWPLQLDIDLSLRDGRWLMSAARATTY